MNYKQTKKTHKKICPSIIDEIIKIEVFDAVNYKSSDFNPSTEQKQKIFNHQMAKFSEPSERAFIEYCVTIFFNTTKFHPRNSIKFANWFSVVYKKKAESAMKEFRDCYDEVYNNKQFDSYDNETKTRIIEKYKNAFHQQNNVVRINFNVNRVFKICGKNAYRFITMQKQFENKTEMQR